MNHETEVIIEAMIDELLHEECHQTLKVNRQKNEHSEDFAMALITLKGDCSIYEISYLHQQVREQYQKSMADKSDIKLDASEVTEVDASLVQLLASCKIQAEANEQSFALLNPSEVLLKKISALFMEDFFFHNEQAEDTES